MRGFQTVVAMQARVGAGDDRAIALEHDGTLVIAVADGAGGTSHGATAAQAIVDAVSHAPGLAAAEVLAALDADPRALGGGQATAIVLAVNHAGIRGASVGDSEAWLVDGEHIEVLTAEQQRKPLLGAGARVVAFHAAWSAGATLVVGSDGLFRYARAADIARVARQRSLQRAATEWLELVRLPGGALQDDVAVVACRALA